MHLERTLQQRQWKWKVSFWLVAILLVICGLLSLSVGEIWMLPWMPQGELEKQLLWQLRMPRLIAAMAIGAALAASGAVLQVLLGNPLAEPGVLGISGGASLALVILLFLLPWVPGPWLTMLVAMGGALVFTFLLVSLARMRRVSTTRLLLIGVALGILSGAVVTWAFYFSDDLSQRQLMYWLMGSVGGVSWSHLSVLILLFPALVWLCTRGKQLDVLMLGDIHARQLGLDVPALRWRLILVIALLVGASVALAGVIGFIGLVIPHLLRLALGAENRFLLPLSAGFGALLLAVADVLARVALPTAELPVGVVTTTLGAPVFIWMLLRSQVE
ncbi:vitamin B12 ABC transporter permease BtuC [Photobacterium sp. GJ3]|uniref:vitamin B12 ABC transporter permease BtuC n=1 Tax=Photobacterium sp. GJ3 TaxID=2829502 RepID=UPI001B8BB678|nr:vitamin B12 ABC transporter permease BtuC [Photobacterium sp. GJ3]QUJ68930.1 vitamin B12 ABC transporter permease BtuC [Photobacterium sp. GJ3]